MKRTHLPALALGLAGVFALALPKNSFATDYPTLPDGFAENTMGISDERFAACALNAYVTANVASVDDTLYEDIINAYTTNPDDPNILTEDGLNNVTEISCIPGGTYSVSGLDIFPNLTTLDLHGTDSQKTIIPSLNLVYHPALETLNLENVFFYETTFGGHEGDVAPNLTSLYLRGSNINSYTPVNHPNLSLLDSGDIHLDLPPEYYFELTDSEETYEMDLSSLAFLANTASQTYSIATTQENGWYYPENPPANISADYSLADGIITVKKSPYHALRVVLERSYTNTSGDTLTNKVRVATNAACVGVGFGFDEAIFTAPDDTKLTYIGPQAPLQCYYVGDTINSSFFAESALNTATEIADRAEKTASLDHITLVGQNGRTIAEDTSRIQYKIEPGVDLTGGLVLQFHFTTAGKPKTPNTGLFTNSDGSLKPSAILFSLASLTSSAFVLTFLARRIKKSRSIRRL